MGSACRSPGPCPIVEIPGGCSSVVERQLPKLDVEGSTPFTRSIFAPDTVLAPLDGRLGFDHEAGMCRPRLARDGRRSEVKCISS